MTTLAELKVGIAVDEQSLQSGLNKARSAIDAFATSASAAGSTASEGLNALGTEGETTGNKIASAMTRVRGSLQTLGQSALQTGAYLSASFTAPIAELLRLGGDYQQTLQQVGANTTMTTRQISEMGKTVQMIANATGAPLAQVANGFMHIMNYGFKAAQAPGILMAAAKSGVATGAQVGQTANILSDVLHQFGLSASKAAIAMNELHLASAEGNMTLEDFTQSAGRAFAQSANLHIPLEDVSAALSTMTKHGNNARKSAQQFIEMLLKIDSPSGKVVKVLKALGHETGVNLVNDFSTTGIAARGFPAILNDIAEAAKKAKLPLSDVLSKVLPGTRGSMMAGVLIHGSGKADFNSIKNDLEQAKAGNIDPIGQGFASSQKNLNTQLMKLKNSFTELGLTILKNVMPELNTLFHWVKDAVTWFEKLPEPVKKLGSVLLLVGAAAGPLLMAFGAVSLGISSVLDLVVTLSPIVEGVVTALAGAFPEISVPILAVIAVVALLYEAWTHDWGHIREYTSLAWTWIKGVVEAGIKYVWKVINEVVASVMATFQTLWVFLKFVWREIVSYVHGSVGAVELVLHALGSCFTWLKGPLEILWSGVKGVFGAIYLIVKDTVGMIAGALKWIGQELGKVTGWTVRYNVDMKMLNGDPSAIVKKATQAHTKTPHPHPISLKPPGIAPTLPDIPGASSGSSSKAKSDPVATYLLGLQHRIYQVNHAGEVAGVIWSRLHGQLKKATTAQYEHALALAKTLTAMDALKTATQTYDGELQTQQNALMQANGQTALQAMQYRLAKGDLDKLTASQKKHILTVFEETQAINLRNRAHAEIAQFNASLSTGHESVFDKTLKQLMSEKSLVATLGPLGIAAMAMHAQNVADQAKNNTTLTDALKAGKNALMAFNKAQLQGAHASALATLNWKLQAGSLKSLGEAAAGGNQSAIALVTKLRGAADAQDTQSEGNRFGNFTKSVTDQVQRHTAVLSGLSNPGQAGWLKYVAQYQSQMQKLSVPDQVKALSQLRRAWLQISTADSEVAQREGMSAYLGRIQRQIAQMEASTPLDKFASKFLEVNKNGQVVQPYSANQLRQMQTAKNQLDQMKRVQDAMQKLAGNIKSIFEKSLGDLMKHGFRGFFADIVNGFEGMLQKMAASYLSSQISSMLMHLAGGSKPKGGNGLIGAVTSIAGFLTPRASGGPVSGGAPYLVGEKGPELFMPGSSGHIVPHHQLAGIGGHVFNFNISTPDAGSFRQSMGQIMAEAGRQANYWAKKNG